MAENEHEGGEEQQWIKHYFQLGYQHDVIIQFLSSYHGINISLSTLKRRLRDLGLRRRGVDVNIREVERLVRRQMDGSGELCGYRSVWHALRLEQNFASSSTASRPQTLQNMAAVE